ncbi:2',3'-cyclic-nucleotide 2'-phosphodiesterase [Bacillus cereus FRI-35]|nr:2',3'-cyclic-nucleotide 2'-phosphodiesterase [Bacillus cereus FRI-35]
MQKMKWKNYLCYLVIFILLGTAIIVKPSTSKAEESDVNITLLGTADIHGRFMPWDYALDGANTSGSLTQLYTVIKKVRQENPNTILVDAGDTIQGNSVELFNDQPQSPMMVAMNAMGYDAWAFGNHEFNFGLDTLKKVSEQYKGKTLAGNINPNLFKHIKTKGEFYKKLSKSVKKI